MPAHHTHRHSQTDNQDQAEQQHLSGWGRGGAVEGPSGDGPGGDGRSDVRGDARGDARRDEEVLAAYVAGDRDAFAVLVGRYQRELTSVVRRHHGWAERDPEALVQEVWCDVARAAAGFEGRSSVRTWLWRIALHRALDSARRRDARPVEVPLSDDRDAFDTADGRDTAAATEDRMVVAGLLAQLPAPMRQVVALVYLDEVPMAEAAARLGIAVGTVKSRCGRARALMLAQLQREHDDD